MSSRIFAGSSACPSSTLFKEAVELLIILNRNLLCFNFVAMLKAWRIIEWYHKVPVICLDPRLLVMKFCFRFCYFAKSFLHKKASHWLTKTSYLREEVVKMRKWCKNVLWNEYRACFPSFILLPLYSFTRCCLVTCTLAYTCDLTCDLCFVPATWN